MIVKAVVAYDGYGYHGFQKQKNGKSIQETLEKALTKIHKKPTAVIGSGRTDAGVHALNQVISFTGNPSISMKGYINALNTLLPKDIRIKSAQVMPDDFHARFSATKKRYEYFYTTEKDNPFIYRYKTILWEMPDIEKMREAAQIFMGRHDFTSFTNAKIHPEKPRVKNIMRLDILEEGKDLHLVFEADGFLRYQVRMMCAALLAVGQNKMTPARLKEILEARDKEAFRLNAPAQGLYLSRVFYDEEEGKSQE